ncbi:hypothetical protein [Nonlabens ponticola]|uniref:hypothetical protein n=1 Tax=Nonlabens ponticola TaxID=2496866 RepID=UPI001F49350D|nr:hypothetical protein [Nonlabens ponticola]
MGYRNFILSAFTSAVTNHFDHVVIFSGLPAVVYQDLNPDYFTVVELPIYRENKKQWFIRKLRETAHLRLFPDNDGIVNNLKKNYRSGWRPNDILVKAIYAISRIAPSEKRVQQFERWRDKDLKKSSIHKEINALMQQHRVDQLFFTHQRPPFIALLVIAARELGIPSTTFIFSWDNLASKGRMAATFDHYLVWSDLMKSDLLEFYKSVDSKQITVVGTPQFEPYTLPAFELEKEWFFDRFDLDATKKVICYSCADKSIGPNDPLVISTIAQAIKDQKIKSAQLLVRTSPAEDPARFREVQRQFPSIKWNEPLWKSTRDNHPEPWSQRIPQKADIAELRAILEYSDLNINMLSTMSLDFMLFDKPVVNTVFGNKENGLYNDQRFLSYQHYKTVVDSGAVEIAKNAEELITAINYSLAHPKSRLSQQRDIIKLQISKPLEGTSARIAQTLINLS